MAVPMLLSCGHDNRYGQAEEPLGGRPSGRLWLFSLLSLSALARPFAVTGAVSADLPTRGNAVNFDQNSATNQFGLKQGECGPICGQCAAGH